MVARFGEKDCESLAPSVPKWRCGQEISVTPDSVLFFRPARSPGTTHGDTVADPLCYEHGCFTGRDGSTVRDRFNNLSEFRKWVLFELGLFSAYIPKFLAKGMGIHCTPPFSGYDSVSRYWRFVIQVGKCIFTVRGRGSMYSVPFICLLRLVEMIVGYRPLHGVVRRLGVVSQLLDRVVSPLFRIGRFNYDLMSVEQLSQVYGFSRDDCNIIVQGRYGRNGSKPYMQPKLEEVMFRDGGMMCLKKIEQRMVFVRERPSQLPKIISRRRFFKRVKCELTGKKVIESDAYKREFLFSYDNLVEVLNTQAECLDLKRVAPVFAKRDAGDVVNYGWSDVPQWYAFHENERPVEVGTRDDMVCYAPYIEDKVLIKVKENVIPLGDEEYIP
jgi:hypothetical protein